jgi:hypothetical protein
MDKLTSEQRAAMRDCAEAIKNWWNEPPASRESFDRLTRALECLDRLVDTFNNPTPNGQAPDWAKNNPEVRLKRQSRNVN